MQKEFDNLISQLKKCELCKEKFGFQPHPIILGNVNSKIVQISQAPSATVHETLKPFTDLSGKKLKYEWYMIDDDVFYNPDNFYIAALSHCYPGKDKNSNVKILPPPEIRIGHGIYFDKNNVNYVRMLQELGAIIEINASSNFALGNIDEYNTLPYDHYLKNGIPTVISTDGHGLYDTSLKVEDYIASKVSKYYKIIPPLEEKIIEGKMKR